MFISVSKCRDSYSHEEVHSVWSFKVEKISSTVRILDKGVIFFPDFIQAKKSCILLHKKVTKIVL
jgi:hypothetical protein